MSLFSTFYGILKLKLFHKDTSVIYQMIAHDVEDYFACVLSRIFEIFLDIRLWKYTVRNLFTFPSGVLSHSFALQYFGFCTCKGPINLNRYLKAGFHLGEFGCATKRWEHQGMRSLKSKPKASVYWRTPSQFW